MCVSFDPVREPSHKSARHATTISCPIKLLHIGLKKKKCFVLGLDLVLHFFNVFFTYSVRSKFLFLIL